MNISQSKLTNSLASIDSFKELQALLKEEGLEVISVICQSVVAPDFIMKVLSNQLKKSYLYCKSNEDYNESLQFYIQYKTKYKELKSWLVENFKHVKKVSEHGEFSLQGDQVIIFTPIYDYPIRIDFFGEDIEAIYLYDPFFAKDKEKLREALITSNQSLALSNRKYQIDSSKKFIFSKSKFTTNVRGAAIISFDFKDAHLYFGNLKRFREEVSKLVEQDYQIFLDIEQNTFEELRIPKTYQIDISSSRGFISDSSKLALFTKREIFSNIRLNKRKRRSRLEFFDIDVEVGQYLVHEDHGIGIFRGINEKEVLGKKQEYIEIEYLNKDKLYIPMDQLAKITKYEGFGKNPKLTRLNSREWVRITNKVKKSVDIVARELMQVYAGRELIRGFNFLKDDELQSEFESKFKYELTVDQERCLEEIKQDMESSKHMDRLLVGDVGFGKTELAAVASFKAVRAGKQVAILVPTTILASQHFAVFKDRFKDFGINIEYLSRFSTKSELTAKVEKINEGKVDIVIGTHRLLRDDIKFKDLGLLIIDEEQKFGVKQKEKIKSLKLEVDILSMSATPIPRSLYMSMIGLRDISVLNSPPKGRLAIVTDSFGFDWEKVAKKIQFELNRGGQVYFLHNEVRTIDSIANHISQIVVDAKVVTAHGQMPPGELEKQVESFYKQEANVLVSTTIIQNGLDMPNVNTIIINKAQKLGLSQLYQLRGRVGRSSKQAYCYLVYPKQVDTFKEILLKQDNYDVNEQSAGMERINTLLGYQALGSGFSIASKDLEMRGAGSILGYKQAGSIEAIGLSLYLDILSAEVAKMKQNHDSL